MRKPMRPEVKPDRTPSDTPVYGVMLKRAEAPITITENPDFTAEKYGTGPKEAPEARKKGGKDKTDYVSLDDWLWIDRSTRTGSRQRLRVTVTEFRGKWGLNIRVWYMKPGTDEWRPTWKGIYLNPEEARAIAKSILAGMEHCDEMEKKGESPF